MVSLQPRSVVGGLFLRTLLWLIPSLAIWYALRDYLVVFPAWIADHAMRTVFSWAESTELQGTVQLLLTSIQVPHASGRVALLTPEAHILSYAFGFPLLVALFLGAKAKQLWWKIPLGYVVLSFFQAWGICFSWLLAVTQVSGDVALLATRFSTTEINLIALGYQLGYLLFPAMAPILLWVYLERRMVATVAVEGALSSD